jgi:parallel beta-helix repeat protein
MKPIFVIAIAAAVIFGASVIPSSDAAMMDNPQCDYSKVICISNHGWECNEIGKWNQNSKTCTMMKNVAGKFIDIVDSGITLDGNGYKISGKFSEEMLKENGDPRNRVIDVKASNVEIKNISVEGFPECGVWGIYNTKICGVGVGTNFADLVVKNSNFFNHSYGLAVVPLPETWSERNCIIENNTFSNSENGASTFGCTIKNNEFANNGMGFWSQGLGDNVFFGNYFYQNDNGLKDRDGEIFQNTFENNGRDVIRNSHSNEKLYHNNFINNIQNYAHGNQNYYDFFDTKEEGCITSPKNNFCPSLGKDDFWTGEPISYTFFDGREVPLTPAVRVFDPKPWRIQDGWLYDITVPADMEVKTDSSDGNTISYHVTGSGPDGIMPVTCNYASGSTFPIGTTEVICSLENGFVSSFLVTIVEDTSISAVMGWDSTPDSSNDVQNQPSGDSSQSSYGMGVVAIILFGIVAIIWKIKSQRSKSPSGYKSDTKPAVSATPIQSVVKNPAAQFIEEKRDIWRMTGENFFVIKQWPDPNGHIFLKLKFDSNTANLFINRNKTPDGEGHGEHGVIFPLEMIGEVSNELQKETSTQTQYSKGTSKDITVSGINTFELIRQFEIKRNGVAGEKMNLKLIHNNSREWLFLSNLRMDGTEKHGANIPRILVSEIVSEMRRFSHST